MQAPARWPCTLDQEQALAKQRTNSAEMHGGHPRRQAACSTTTRAKHTAPSPPTPPPHTLTVRDVRRHLGPHGAHGAQGAGAACRRARRSRDVRVILHQLSHHLAAPSRHLVQHAHLGARTQAGGWAGGGERQGAAAASGKGLAASASSQTPCAPSPNTPPPGSEARMHMSHYSSGCACRQGWAAHRLMRTEGKAGGAARSQVVGRGAASALLLNPLLPSSLPQPPLRPAPPVPTFMWPYCTAARVRGMGVAVMLSRWGRGGFPATS